MAGGTSIRTQRRPRRGTAAVSLLAAVLVVAALPVAPGGIAPVAAAPSAFPTIDGEYEGDGALGPGDTYVFRVDARAGIPADGVDAVVLNVAVTNATAPSFLTLYPSDVARPLAANMNFAAGQTTSNMVIAKVGSFESVAIYNLAGNVDVVVDVLGYFPTDEQYRGLTPARLVDTRPGLPTIDGASAGGGPVGPGGTLEFVVTDRGGVPATGVGAVALNVAVTNGTAPSFLTVWPTGQERPVAANMNFAAGQTTSNMVIAKVGSGGRVSVFNLAGNVDIVVDVLGWYPEGGEYTGLTPARLADTRPGLSTIDGAYVGGGAVPANGTVELDVTDRGGVPATGVGAVALNVAVTNGTAPSFLTVFPTGQERPLAASMNFAAGQTTSNMAIAKVGNDGRVSIYNLAGGVDAVVDVLGWFPTGGEYVSMTPARFVDTRFAPRGGPLVFDFSGGVGLTLGSPFRPDEGASNLRLVGPNGLRDPAVSGSARITQLQRGADGLIYLAFDDPVNVLDTAQPGTCKFAVVPSTGGAAACIDSTLTQIGSDVNTFGGTAPFLQFDAAANAHYVGSTGALSSSIIRRTPAGATTNLLSLLVTAQSMAAHPDGRVIAGVLHLITDEYLLRRILPNGAESNVVFDNRIEWLEVFPDGNVYFGVFDDGQWRVKRYLTASDSVDPVDWINASGVGASNAAAPFCGPADVALNQAFCGPAGAGIQDMQTSAGRAFALLPPREDDGLPVEGGIVMRYFPTFAKVQTSVVLAREILGTPQGLVIAGDDSLSRPITVKYDPATGAEQILVPASAGVGVYELAYEPSTGQVLYQGFGSDATDDGFTVGRIDLTNGSYSEWQGTDDYDEIVPLR